MTKKIILYVIYFTLIAYICWEAYWFTQVGFNFIKWHTYVVFYGLIGWLGDIFLLKKKMTTWIKVKSETILLFFERKHRFIRYCLYSIIVLIACYLRFCNLGWLNLDGDVRGYLIPALNFVDTFELNHELRSYPYPLFVGIILLIFKNLDAILVTQHILSILSLVMAILYIEKTFIQSEYDNHKKRLKFILFCLFLISCFWSQPIVYFEKTLRPEGLILPSVLLIFFLLSKYIVNHNLKKKTHWILLLNIFALILFSLLHPRYSLSFYAVILIVSVHFFYNSQLSIFKKISVLFLAFFTLLLVILPEKYLVNKYDKSSEEFAYRQFFFSNMKPLAEAIKKKDYLFAGIDTTVLKWSIEKTLFSDKKYQYSDILGYDLDYPQYELFPHYLDSLNNGLRNKEALRIINEQISIINSEKRRPNKNDWSIITNKINSLGIKVKIKVTMKLPPNYYQSWFWKLCLNYPIDISKKTANQMVHYFFDYKVPLSAFAKNPWYDKKYYDNFSNHTISNRIKYTKVNSYTYHYPEMLFYLYYFVDFVGRVLLVLFTITYLVKLFFLRKTTLIGLISFILLFITVFTIGFLHTFDLQRYIDSLFPITMLFLVIEGYTNYLYYTRKNPKQLT